MAFQQKTPPAREHQSHINHGVRAGILFQKRLRPSRFCRWEKAAPARRSVFHARNFSIQYHRSGNVNARGRQFRKRLADLSRVREKSDPRIILRRHAPARVAVYCLQRQPAKEERASSASGPGLPHDPMGWKSASRLIELFSAASRRVALMSPGCSARDVCGLSSNGLPIAFLNKALAEADAQINVYDLDHVFVFRR